MPVTQAIILAAGNGDRFASPDAESKLLRDVLGVPLISRTLHTAARAGIRHADIVVGYQAERVRDVVLRHQPDLLSVRFHLNERWREENGLSALIPRAFYEDRRFALLMADHVFESDALQRVLDAPAGALESLLGVDRRPAPADLAAEATRVRLGAGDRIVNIGKMIEPYDALDTGLFVCAPPLFEALNESCGAGDTTLSGGIRLLAARGLVRGVDIGDAVWYDIDTVADLESAEGLLGARASA